LSQITTTKSTILKEEGRKFIEQPPNWKEIYTLYATRQLTAKKAMELMGLKNNTFYRFVAEERKKLSNNGNF